MNLSICAFKLGDFGGSRKGSIPDSFSNVRNDPACQNEKEHLPGMQSRFHINSGYMYWEIPASGISIPESITTKNEIFSYFQVIHSPSLAAGPNIMTTRGKSQGTIDCRNRLGGMLRYYFGIAA
jgi:hypothetical protein